MVSSESQPYSRKIIIVGNDQGSSFTLTETHLTVRRKQEKKWDWVQYDVPLRHVVWASLENGKFEVSFLARKRNKRKGPLFLQTCSGVVDEVVQDLVGGFMQDLQNAAYAGVRPERRLKVLVNPKAGPGKSIQIFNRFIVPLLRAAKCPVDVTVTTHFQHAIEIAKTLPLDKFDAVVAVGGDGMIYEVLNGFAQHPDPLRALKMPVAPVPTGSGNGLSLNLLGLEEGLDVLAAALNGAKGVPMAVDVVSVAQGPERSLSFMTQTTGLMAEADLQSEHLRALGSARFMVYFLLGVAKHRRVPIKIQVKVEKSDKQKMVEDMRAARAQAKENLELRLSKSRSTHTTSTNVNTTTTTDKSKTNTITTTTDEGSEGQPAVTTSGPYITTHTPPEDADGAGGSSGREMPMAMPPEAEPFEIKPLSSPPDTRKSLPETGDTLSSGSRQSSAETPPPSTPPPTGSSMLPPLKYASLKDEELKEEDGWVTITDPMLWYMAGKGPYVGESFMSFPVSVPNDGLIDVAIHKPTSRAGLIKAIDGAEKGKQYWQNDELYYKATAYRVTPLPSKRRSCVSIDGEHFKFEQYHVEVHPSLANLLSPYGYYCPEFEQPAPPSSKAKRG